MLTSIQFLRFLAALMVVIYHSATTTRTSDASLPGWFMDLAWLGSAGVPVFFAISGLVMTVSSQGSFRSPGASATFLWRRFLRIYPIYWVAALFFLLFPPDYLANWHQRPWDILLSLFLLPGHAAGIITPGWTLAYELYFYLVFALMLLLPWRLAFAAMILVFGASVAAGGWLAGINPFFRMATNVQLLVFLSGVVIAWLFVTPPSGTTRPLARISPGLILAFALAGFAVAPVLRHLDLPTTLTLGVPSILLVAAAAQAEAQGRVPRIVRSWSWLGNSSYAVYLIHMLVIWHATDWLGPATDGLVAGALRVCVLTVLSLAAGLVVHLLFERPLMRWLKQRRRQRAKGTAASQTPTGRIE